jgi:hypothetical protein
VHSAGFHMIHMSSHSGIHCTTLSSSTC